MYPTIYLHAEEKQTLTYPSTHLYKRPLLTMLSLKRVPKYHVLHGQIFSTLLFSNIKEMFFFSFFSSSLHHLLHL